MKILVYSFVVLCLGYASLEQCKENGLYPSEKMYRELSLASSEPENFVQKAGKRGQWECKSCHASNPNYTLFCGMCWK
jgi:hypothetical protein